MKTYTPRNDSFPHRTLMYLKENGQSKNEDIRRDIGLDKHSSSSIYSDRSSYHFARLIPRLIYRGLVNRVRTGYYELTMKGRALMTEMKDKELVKQLITLNKGGYTGHEIDD